MSPFQVLLLKIPTSCHYTAVPRSHTVAASLPPEDTAAAVAALCVGKATCTLAARSVYFGEACPGSVRLGSRGVHAKPSSARRASRHAGDAADASSSSGAALGARRGGCVPDEKMMLSVGMHAQPRPSDWSRHGLTTTP